MSWRAVFWTLLRPAIVAMIVAVLTAWGVSTEMQRQQVSVAGITHFSGVYSNDDVQAVDDLIAGDDVTVADDLTVTGAISAEDLASTDDASVADDLTVGGNISMSDGYLINSLGAVTVTDALYVTGGEILAGLQVWTYPEAAKTITVTQMDYITPTVTFQPLYAAGAVFTDKLATLAAGRFVILYNTVNQTITISDTSTVMLASTFGMTQYDMLGLISDGTNMVEVFRSVN